tara:strand:+ start:161 stop:346 length:186 start_codon:yes stop_codon:yes gene_type:complete
MEKPDLMSNVRIQFLEANTFEEAKKMVPLKENNVATFEVLEEEFVEHVKRNDKTVDRLLRE